MTERTVVITGGNKGIGAALSRAFAYEGYYVMIGARTDTGLARELGDHARFHEMDVRFEEAHEVLAKETVRWKERLNVYINCAGFSKWSPITDVNEQFWNEMIDTNLKGTFWGCKAAACFLEKGGCIINISSLAGRRGTSHNSVYCASKFGVTGLTQALAKELGPRGIRVNAVCPVLIKTDGLVAALSEEHAPAHHVGVEGFLSRFVEEQSALKRLPTADEVARTCLFLASEAASAITGQSLHVDCGVFPF